MINMVEASYPARPALSRRPRSHWSVLTRRRGSSRTPLAVAFRPPARCCVKGFDNRRLHPDSGSTRGLTGRARPLYSAGFATSASGQPLGRCPKAPVAELVDALELKIEFRKECWFDSGQGHQLGCSSPFQSVRNRPRSARKPLKNRHFRVHRCSSPFVLIRSQPSDLLVFLLVSGEQTFTATFAIPNEGIEQMARKNDGACANPKQIRTDVDCRAARPKFDKGAWSPAKISDVTGGGLYLFVTPDESRPGNAASKLWRMGYRFHSRQKTYSIGPYGNGKDGTFSLADARRERDKAKDLLKEGKDPSTEKQLDKHRQAAARPFEQWADEWLAKKKVEKVKRGRIVAVRDPKTIEVLELRVGYVKDRFGKLLQAGHQASGRARVHAFIRSRGKAGNPRPRAQHR